MPLRRHEIDQHADQQAVGNLTSDRLRGTIKRLIVDRAFGFIKVPSGQEYFFHASDVRDLQFGTLQEGGSVTFRPGRTAKGPRAEDVDPT